MLDEAGKLAAELADYRVWVDRREGHSPGYKFNDWEMRGVPLRVELGPRDVAAGQVVVARRDRPLGAGKQAVARSGAAAAVGDLLREVQAEMYDRALRFREANTRTPSSFDGFKEAVETGFASVWWCEDEECEAAIKETTGATSRCIPLDQPEGSGPCFRDGRPAARKAIFARAY